MPLKRHQTDGAVHLQGQPPYGYGYPQQPGYGPMPYPYAPGPSPGYYPSPQAGYGEQSCGTLSFRRFCCSTISDITVLDCICMIGR